MKQALFAALLCAAAASAVAAPLPDNRNIDIAVSNSNGAQYGEAPNDTYFISAPGGGLNQLHISTDGTVAGLFGQVTTKNIGTSSTSGSFYVTTTGGRGFNDALILAFSMTGPISDDFSLRIKSSGYQWEATGLAPVNPAYVEGAIDEIFTADDFLYGPQTAKPGPGSGWTLPFWSGQDIDDPSTAQNFMFIDLYLGNTSDRSSINAGSALVEFELEGLYDARASFNVYAWALVANIDDSSINWTNRLSTNPNEAGQSGYSIVGTAQRVPEPGPAALVAAGLSALLLARRRTR